MRRIMFLLLSLALLPSVAVAEEYMPYLDDAGSGAVTSPCARNNDSSPGLSENRILALAIRYSINAVPTAVEKSVGSEPCVIYSENDNKGSGFDSDNSTLLLGD
jgi:hypothetical protein